MSDKSGSRYFKLQMLLKINEIYLSDMLVEISTYRTAPSSSLFSVSGAESCVSPTRLIEKCHQSIKNIPRIRLTKSYDNRMMENQNYIGWKRRINIK